MTRTSYPTDLTDEQWQIIASLVPAPKPGGRPAEYPRREIVNAILYQARNGGVWRALPHDLPPYRIVFHYFRAWQKDGTWDRIHDRLRTRVRQLEGKAHGGNPGQSEREDHRTCRCFSNPIRR